VTTDPTPPDPWETAANAVDRAIRDVAKVTHGEAATETVPAWTGATWTRDQVKPLAALDALITLRLTLAQQIGRFARLARERGDTWDDIAVALGVEADEDDYRSRGEMAFRMVVPEPRNRMDEWTSYYRCDACDTVVVDGYPAGGPVDSERGHDPNCTRREADIAAQEAAWASEAEEG